jgi:hypothetical protein
LINQLRDSIWPQHTHVHTLRNYWFSDLRHLPNLWTDLGWLVCLVSERAFTCFLKKKKNRHFWSIFFFAIGEFGNSQLEHCINVITCEFCRCATVTHTHFRRSEIYFSFTLKKKKKKKKRNKNKKTVKRNIQNVQSNPSFWRFFFSFFFLSFFICYDNWWKKSSIKNFNRTSIKLRTSSTTWLYTYLKVFVVSVQCCEVE